MLKVKVFTILNILIIPIKIYANPFLSREKVGDIYWAASMFYAYGMTIGKEDWIGSLQYTETLAASLLFTEGLKRIVREKRPNGKDRKSFPSGHATGAFSGAVFVHRRYGIKYAIPPYLMATLVAWSRVDQKAHYVHDVIAGFGVSVLFGWLLVDKYDFQVSLNSDSLSITYGTSF